MPRRPVAAPKETARPAYRRRGRIERRDTWPAVLATETLADFLDCLRADGRVDDAAFARWRTLAGFPAPDRATGMWYRRDVEEFLDSRRRRADPGAASADYWDQRFGTARAS